MLQERFKKFHSFAQNELDFHRYWAKQYIFFKTWPIGGCPVELFWERWEWVLFE